MKSILLVDDEPLVCAAIKAALARFGFRAQAVHNIEGAICAVRRRDFDAILLELNVKSKHKPHPRTGAGLQIISELRASANRAPILILTFMSGALYETAALKAGADDFIPKTDGIVALMARLSALVAD